MTAPGKHPASQAAPVVAVRLTSEAGACSRLALILAGAPGLEVIRGPRGPYACGDQASIRWYLTLRQSAGLPVNERGAAHSRQASHRPATPVPAKENQEKRGQVS
jgi:hypothetical protein